MNSGDIALPLACSDICHKMKGLEVLACGTKTLRTTYSSKNKSEPKPRAQNKLEGFFPVISWKKDDHRNLVWVFTWLVCN